MKLNLSDVNSVGSISTINSNFEAIEQELQNKVAYRDNPSGEPNTFESNIDLNGNGLYNSRVVRTQELFIDGVQVVPSGVLEVTGAGIVDYNVTLQKANNLSDLTSVSAAKTVLGIDLVDNTSDISKPISTATTSALAGKQATLVSGTNIKTINGASVLGGGNITLSSTVYETYIASYAGADPTGVTSSNAAFTAAQAAAGTTGQVRITKGIWNLASDTPSCNWVVDAGASFTGSGKLVGRVVYDGRFDTFPTPKQGFYAGRPVDPMIGVGHYNDIPAAIRGVSPYACTGVLGVSQSSDNPTTGAMGCIGVTAFSNNNNVLNRQYSYGIYIEAHRQSGAGSTLGLEIDVANHGSTEQITPNGWGGGIDGVMDVTSLLWLASGGDTGGVNNVSCAIGIINNGAASAKGIVFVNGSVASDTAPVGGIEYDALSLPYQYAINWWDTGNIKRVSIRGEAAPSGGGGLLVMDGPLNFVSQPTTLSAGAGGTTIPATCLGYWVVRLGGSLVKIPFFG